MYPLSFFSFPGLILIPTPKLTPPLNRTIKPKALPTNDPQIILAYQYQHRRFYIVDVRDRGCSEEDVVCFWGSLAEV